jgi:hypothetical protein
MAHTTVHAFAWLPPRLWPNPPCALAQFGEHTSYPCLQVRINATSGC